MRRALSIGIAAVVLLLFSAFVYLTIYIINSKYCIYTDTGKGPMRKPEYHFVVIAESTDDPYWQSVRRGCLEAAAKYNVAVEFNGPRFTSIEEELQCLDIAIACRVDAVATHVLDEKKFVPLINKAVEANIPVVTLDVDAKNSKRLSFIGTNSYKLGTEAGRLTIEATQGQAEVAVILSSCNVDGENIMHNLRVAGFKDTVKDTAGIKIKTIQTSGTGYFSAEEVTKNILNNFPEVNTILCTSAKDTIGVAQVIVDMNRVGRITIIGSDDTPDILRYVEKGVIFGSVTGNPHQTGYESIKAMVELKKNKMTSSYVDTGVQVITRENLGAYREQSVTVKESSAKK